MSAAASAPSVSRPRQQAPTWQADRDCKSCTKCKSPFSFFVRKHHCRHCGFIFCEECSAKTCSIPQFDINTPVRVCDDCFTTVKRTNFDFNI
mmetsp:Transcript_27176/g.54692  ORF Transcript_27176/g.54692 Transcript_27176/m.54692 type:complete len:92 (+) Transcript_27176:100-375(+)